MYSEMISSINSFMEKLGRTSDGEAIKKKKKDYLGSIGLPKEHVKFTYCMMQTHSHSKELKPEAYKGSAWDLSKVVNLYSVL